MQLTDEQVKKAQMILLTILKEVDRVCAENDIHYFLAYGTLIGAIRHNGFIPWDDDIDIGMLREDYDKFCKIAPVVLNNEYILQNSDTDNGFALDYSKLILKGTKWIEEVTITANRMFEGLWVDILPFDKIPESRFLRQIQKYKMKFYNMFMTIKLNYNCRRTGIKKIFYYFTKIFTTFISIKKIKKSRDKLVRKYSAKDTNLLTNLTFYDCSIVDKKSLVKLEKHRFEDFLFYIPSDYDKVLTDIYGNYMELPPVEKRRTHEIVSFDFGEY